MKIRPKPVICEASRLLLPERIQTLFGYYIVPVGSYVVTDPVNGHKWGLHKDDFSNWEVVEADAVEKSAEGLKVLVACNTCWKDVRNGSDKAIRETWAAKLPKGWDLKFFVGGRNFTAEEEATLFTESFLGSPGTLGNVSAACAAKAVIGTRDELQDDEIILADVPDGYLGLPWKTVESLKWAMKEGYDYVFRIFVDTYAFPDRLLKSGFQNYDASGWSFGCIPCQAHPETTHSCPLGGAGYWLSRKAMQAVIDEPIQHWGEDTHVGFALANAGIDLVYEHRLQYDKSAEPLNNRSKLSIHLNERFETWNVQKQYDAHAEQTKAAKLMEDWDGHCRLCGSYETVRSTWGPKCKQCGARQ